MDPVTGLGMSCNLLQLIRDAATTGQAIHKICKTGKLEGIDNLEKSLQDFDKLIEVSKDLSSLPCSHASIETARTRAAQVLLTCASDAALLRTELGKLKTSREGVRRLGFALKVPSVVPQARSKMQG